MEEEGVIHYYNAVSGKCVCGAEIPPGKKTYTVFPENVTCENCLQVIGKTEGQ